MVDVELRDNLCKILAECNNVDSFDNVIDDYTSVLNCSRNEKFIKLCINVIESSKLQLRSDFIIIKE